MANREKWQSIKIEGLEDCYEISNCGKVFSIPRVVRNTGCLNANKMIVRGKFLKQNLDSFGYLIVNLNKNKKRKTVKVHILVWDAFGNKPRNGRKLQIDHINNDKTDNRIENLQLLTNKENCKKGKEFHKQRRMANEV